MKGKLKDFQSRCEKLKERRKEELKTIVNNILLKDMDSRMVSYTLPKCIPLSNLYLTKLNLTDEEIIKMLSELGFSLDEEYYRRFNKIRISIPSIPDTEKGELTYAEDLVREICEKHTKFIEDNKAEAESEFNRFCELLLACPDACITLDTSGARIYVDEYNAGLYGLSAEFFDQFLEEAKIRAVYERSHGQNEFVCYQVNFK